ncbi:MAG: hypothetical protein AB7O52_05820 [Planctomycetota bacterium]
MNRWCALARGPERVRWIACFAGITWVCAGCAQVPQLLLPLELEWQVREEDHELRSDPDIMRLPPRFHGREVWWFAEGQLVRRHWGLDDTGVHAERITWMGLIPDWVVHFDMPSGRVHAVPLGLWHEERRRRSRASYLAVQEAQREGALAPNEIRFFLGDGVAEEFDRPAGAWWAVGAVPGRLWKLSGRSATAIPWQAPLLALALPGVTAGRAPAIGQVLVNLRPTRIESVALPRGDRAVVTRYTLTRSRKRAVPSEVAVLGGQAAQRTLERETARGDFESLWRLLAAGDGQDAGDSPPDLTRRELRARLERFATVAHLEVIRARLEMVADAAEREELFHLVEAASALEFDRWLTGAVAARDLPTIVPMISVRSLKRPAGLVELLDELLAGQQALLAGQQASSSATRPDEVAAWSWLRGVREWSALEYAVPSAGPP